MATRTTDDVVRIGRGIQISYEALMEILRSRFTNLIDWESLPGMPAVDVSPVVGNIALYWTGFAGWEDDSPFFRRLGEGAPIPVFWITTRNLFVNDTNVQRCGFFEETTDHFQCSLELNHESDVHEFEKR